MKKERREGQRVISDAEIDARGMAESDEKEFG